MNDAPADGAELQRVWDANAAFWDEYVGAEGNAFHRLLVGPAQLRLLELSPGQRVLELACGNGQFTREIVGAGAHVVATDFSATFIELAQRHTLAAGMSADFRLADSTDEQQLRALGEPASFDSAVCTMAIHDIADLAPMASALRSLLKANGWFVFSVVHPAFNGSNPTFVNEVADVAGDIKRTHSLKISRYHGCKPYRGLGIIGQPEPHWYFPRTIEGLLAPFFAEDWTLDGLLEPSFLDGILVGEDPSRWMNIPSIPPVLVVRLRRSV